MALPQEEGGPEMIKQRILRGLGNVISTSFNDITGQIPNTQPTGRTQKWYGAKLSYPSSICIFCFWNLSVRGPCHACRLIASPTFVSLFPDEPLLPNFSQSRMMPDRQTATLNTLKCKFIVLKVARMRFSKILPYPGIHVTGLLTSRHPLFRWFRVIIERTGNKLACGSNVEAHSLL